MTAILALDASWGGCGLALIADGIVVDVGHVRLAGRTWRWSALNAWMTETFDPLLAELELRGGRVVLEEPPAVYQRGNQAATGYGLGLICGALLARSCRPTLGYPWEVRPDEWRSWWNLKGKGRQEKKRVAILMCRQLGHGRQLDRFPETDEDLAPRSDVAEAILLGLGAARHLKDAPKGPARVADTRPTGVLFQPRRGA